MVLSVTSKMDLEETFRRSLYTSYGENKCILLPKDKYIKTVGELLETTQAPMKSQRQIYLLNCRQINPV